MTRAVRCCAIYTRKSTEDGLDQEFNSLDAQREACEAFIASQRSEGWKPLPDRFDDGGVSGGTLEREAIQRLLDNVDAGKIDIVVVYKIDRLTRSLADFAKIVERLDKRGASFVSVTQQFNTSTSMGRLTLNVLLSFAQFEREVTAERIRDKIAASKKKGLWMGGYVPLGHDAVDRKLIVNAREAKIVRSIYSTFVEGACVKQIAADLGAKGIASKARSNGLGEKRFSRGALYKILSNPIYCGKVRHGKAVYDGVHEPIIGQEIWGAAAARLEAGKRRTGGKAQHHSPLAGKIFADGEALTPTHAYNHGRRYRYYVSRSLTETGASDSSGWRLPAAELEGAVAEAVRDWLNSRRDTITPRDSVSIDDASRQTGVIDQLIEGGSQQDNQSYLRDWAETIIRIELDDHAIRISLDPTKLAGGVTTNDDDPSILIERPIRFARRGVGRKLIIGDASIRRDQTMIDLMLLTRRWRSEIFDYGAALKDLAKRDGVDQGDASRFLPLAFLAPNLTLAILEGRQPVSLTAEKLKRLGALPLSWEEQRTLLGH